MLCDYNALKTHIICIINSIKILPRSVNKKNRSVGNLFYNVQKYRDGFGITRAVLFYFHRIVLVKEQFVILSKTGSLYRQPNLFRLFLSTSSVLEHELKTHISDVLKAVYLLLVQIGCFHIYKFFFNPATNHTLPYRYGAERGIHTFHFIAKGGVILKPSDFQKTIQCQFDCKLKKVVKGIVRNYRKELARRQAKEVSFCELPEIVVEKLIVWDDYESEYTTFDVCGTEIRVLDKELAEALKQLPEQSRNIVLMFFFLDMSDSEIGEKLNINRSTSYRHRRNSLEEIRKQLKEKKTNEE